jgi:predicted NACHT family NTPase
VLEGHSAAVNSVVFSHDSTRLASASCDCTMKVWDSSSGACLQTLEGHNTTVNSVVFSHDSTRLASASKDCTVKIWDADNGACLQTLEGHTVRDLSVFFLHNPNDGDMPEDFKQPRRLPYRSIDISRDGSRVMWNSHTVLWLPSEYRPMSYSVSGEMAGIGTGSGKVWICRFKSAD